MEAELSRERNITSMVCESNIVMLAVTGPVTCNFMI